MTKTYTLARIDASAITKAGRELLARMPQDIKDSDTEGRVATILSLMARNGAKAWRAMENGTWQGDLAEWYYEKAWRQPTEEARAEMQRKASEHAAKWVERAEREEEAAERRLAELAALLSEITGHAWRIDTSGGGMGDVLVIPDTVTGARDNSTTYHTNERAIWLSGH